MISGMAGFAGRLQTDFEDGGLFSFYSGGAASLVMKDGSLEIVGFVRPSNRCQNISKGPDKYHV